MEKMTLEEFNKEYRSESSKWNFKKFAIQCAKCTSTKVEFNGYLESESGYYGDHSLEGGIVVKCHYCGNAFKITTGYNNSIELNKNGESIGDQCIKCGEYSSEELCDNCNDAVEKNDDGGSEHE